MTFGVAAFASTPFGATPVVASGGSSAYSVSLGLRVDVATPYSSSAALRVSVAPTVSPSVSLRVNVATPRDIGLPVHLSMLPATVTSPARWRPVVTLGGVDISERLTGEISIQAGEGEARVATFSIAPTAGTLLLPDWTGQPVNIDIAHQADDGSAIEARRLFTGVVDVPDYDLSSHIVTFDCTDQRQEVIGNLPRSWVDEHVAGWYSTAVSGAATDTVRYATDRLASVPAALDLDPYQQPRVTAWALAETPWETFDTGDVIDGSIGLKMASRADLRNEVSTRLQYRVDRLRARVISAQFEQELNFYTSSGLDIPSRAMIEQALSGLSGWTQRGDINYVTVDPGVYESVGGSGTLFTVISAVDAPNLATGFACGFYSRWVQSVTEDYTLTVRAQASIDAIGYARETLSGATLDAQFDATPWLASPTAEPVLTLPTIGDVSMDYGAPGATDRAAAENAIETLVAQARRHTLETHRSTRVSASVPIRADIDLDKRIEVDVGIVRASGKVAALSHRLNIDEGSAITEFHLSISGFSAVGLVQADDAPASPAAPVDPTPAPGSVALGATIGLFIGQTGTSPPYDEATMIGFSTNARAGPDVDSFAPAYPLAMSVGAPEIEAAVRDPITLPQSSTYAVAVPQDILEVTVP